MVLDGTELEFSVLILGKVLFLVSKGVMLGAREDKAVVLIFVVVDWVLELVLVSQVESLPLVDFLSVLLLSAAIFSSSHSIVAALRALISF